MTRKAVPEAELLTWINRELHKNEDYKDCEVTSVTRLVGVDEIGCNWSNPNIQGHGMPAAVCLQAAALVIERARQIFNVE